MVRQGDKAGASYKVRKACCMNTLIACTYMSCSMCEEHGNHAPDDGMYEQTCHKELLSSGSSGHNPMQEALLRTL